MWSVAPSDDYLRRHKRYEKKHSRELAAVLDNLDTFLTALREGAKVQQVKAGFLHPEPLGVLAIDHKGGGKALAETRLYVYPDEDGEVLHIITLGDKRSQADDIGLCREFVAELRKTKGEGSDNG